jgi:hypothetical protein
MAIYQQGSTGKRRNVPVFGKSKVSGKGRSGVSATEFGSLSPKLPIGCLQRRIEYDLVAFVVNVSPRCPNHSTTVENDEPGPPVLWHLAQLLLVSCTRHDEVNCISCVITDAK